MSGFLKVKLGELCEKITDGTHHSPPNSSVGVYKYITAKNIKPWGIDLSDVTYVDAATHQEIYARCDVKKNDVLIIKDGATTGVVAINALEEQFSLLSSVGVLRPSDAVKAKYVFYALQEPVTKARLLDNVAGVAITRLTLRKLSEFEIPFVSVAYQDRIIERLEELLPELDSGIAELKSAQKKLALYRQSLLKAAVEGALTAEWRRQNAGLPTGDDLLNQISATRRTVWEAAQLEKFEAEGRKPPKDWQKKYAEPVRPDGAGLPAVPPEWAWAKVNQTGLVQLGRQRAPQFHTGPNMLPYLRVANVFENRIDVSDVMQMHFSEADEAAYKLAAGDILLNEGQSLELVGRPAIYRGELPNACFTNTLVRYRVEEGVLPEFALAVFLHYMHSGRFRKIATITTNIAHLGAGRFAELEFPLPGTEEQAEIVRRLAEQMESVERQQAAISKALKQAAAQRQNILRAAFSGQLVAQDPGDEPAGVLLERIRAERAAGQAAKPKGRRPRAAKEAA